MNAFVQHHQDSIAWRYSCFDRILCNVIHQELQRGSSVAGFFQQTYPGQVLTKNFFRGISVHYHRWVEDFARQRGIPIVEPPPDVRREDWVERYYRDLRVPEEIAVILKSRENAKVAVSYPTTGTPHLEVCPRFVWQYYFYLNDRDFGRMFLRICPYLPFNGWMCLNGHEWLAQHLRAEGIAFEQSDNSFASCDQPKRLQELADTFGPEHIATCAHRWLEQLVPFFQEPSHRQPSRDYRLFVSQAEYCTNLIFHSRAALDQLTERLLDVNRAIGRPDKLAVIFGRRITSLTVDGMQTRLVDHHLGHPVLRGIYKSCAIKQYVRDHQSLRVEASTYYTPDLGVLKAIEHLPQLRQQLQGGTERWLDVQQDILETYVDRGQLQQLSMPTLTPTGRRTPGLKLQDARLLAVMQALTCFAYLAGTRCFRTCELLPRVLEALGQTANHYTLSRLRYDLAKLRGKGLVFKITGTRSYCLTPDGYRICVLYLKLFHRIYAPLTAGLLEPYAKDACLAHERRTILDRLYAAIDCALTRLLEQVGIKAVG